MERKTLGIVGGMGPKATVNFVDEVIDATPAAVDQEHIPTIIHNDPTIPDRNDAILHDGESPLPKILTHVTALEAQGVDVIAIPCNTAHYFYDEIDNHSTVPVLNMIAAVRSKIERDNVKKAALLATSTVLQTGIYADHFSSADLRLVVPEEADSLMDVIYDIKRGEIERAQRNFDRIVDELRDRGVDSVIVGCTDLSTMSVPASLAVYDSANVLAERCVQATAPTDADSGAYDEP